MMRSLILFLITVTLATAAKASELVVGEKGSVQITLPDQPNNQKCNIEVKFADGSSQDVEVDPKNPAASVSFIPTVAGAQLIQWDGKMKWRGLKSRPPCQGDGNVSITVRERAEVLAERKAKAERLRAEQALETERLKLEAERLKAEREAKATLKRNRQAITNLIAQIDTNDKKQCAFTWIKVKYGDPEQYGITGAQNIATRLMDRYVNGDNPMAVTSETVSGIKRMLDTCNQFFAKERQWDSQTFKPPTGDISCILGSGAESTCYWTYIIYANDAWQDATALQAMEAHITSGEKFWATDLPEKPDAKARREKREADLVRQRAQECKRNPLSDPSCPGYAAAKEKQERREAVAEEKRQLAAAKQPKRFDIPGAYICTNKNSADMAIQLAYSRTSDELASMIRHIPTSRIDMVMTWLYFVPDKRRKNEFNYRNTNIRSTVLTILPKESRVLISGDGLTLEFINCLMMKK